QIYLNDVKGNLIRLQNAFNDEYVTGSCIKAADFNGDCFIDLFLGGRTIPWNYGEIPRSYLLQNDGKGKFIDVTEKNAKELATIGLVTNAAWFDIDNDNDVDLVVTCEWGGITAFINTRGSFVK